MRLAIRRPIGTQRPKLTIRSDGPIFENLPISLWQYDLRVNTSLISLIPIQGKNAAERTFVYLVHEPAVGTTRNRPEGSCGQTARTGGLTDNLDEAKAAFRAAWEVCYRREKPT